MEITTEHQKWPNISRSSVKSLTQRPSPQEVHPRSGLYLLVLVKGIFLTLAKQFYTKKV